MGSNREILLGFESDRQEYVGVFNAFVNFGRK